MVVVLWEEPKRVATSCVVSQVNLSMMNGLVVSSVLECSLGLLDQLVLVKMNVTTQSSMEADILK